MDYTGKWYIYDMELWEDEYFKFNMNMPAVITVDKENLGSLHLGTVSGTIDGDIVKCSDGERFEFTWAGIEEYDLTGIDEYDLECGSGWLAIVGQDMAKGWIKFHLGHRSGFMARKK